MLKRRNLKLERWKVFQSWESKMRESLAYLRQKLQRLDVGYTTDAILDIREVMYQMLELLDVALPKEVEPD
jgi:hypothetical protein